MPSPTKKGKLSEISTPSTNKISIIWMILLSMWTRYTEKYKKPKEKSKASCKEMKLWSSVTTREYRHWKKKQLPSKRKVMKLQEKTSFWTLKYCSKNWKCSNNRFASFNMTPKKRLFQVLRWSARRAAIPRDDFTHIILLRWMIEIGFRGICCNDLDNI